MTRLRIHIDRITVEDPNATTQQAVREAVTRELRERFANGMGQGPPQAMHIPSLQVGMPANSAGHWSATVADAVHGKATSMADGASPTPKRP